MTRWLVLSLLPALPSLLPAAPRSWTDVQGRVVEAEFIRFDEPNVILRVVGREIPFPLQRLSEADQTFVREQVAAAREAALTKTRTLPDGSPLVPGTIQEFILDATDEDRKLASHEGGPLESLRTIRVLLAVPADFAPDKATPMFIADDTTPGRNAARARALAKPGIEEGYIVLGAEAGEIDSDGKLRSWNSRGTCARRALQAIAEMWPASLDWPLYYGGFSGGGKNCYFTAAFILKHLERAPRGFYMAGANELMLDPAREQYKLPSSAMRDVAVFLSNGDEDPTAPVAKAQDLAGELRRMGLKQVRQESFPGGHRQNMEHFTEAVRWFRTGASSG